MKIICSVCGRNIGDFHDSTIFSEKVREYVPNLQFSCKRCDEDFNRISNKIDGRVIGWESLKLPKLNP